MSRPGAAARRHRKLAANRQERALAVGAEAPSLLAGLIVDADGVPKEIKKIGAWWLRLPCPSRSSDGSTRLFQLSGRGQVDAACTNLARKYELSALKTASVIKAVARAGDRGNYQYFA